MAGSTYIHQMSRHRLVLRWIGSVAIWIAFCVCGVAAAAIPEELRPVVVEAQFSFTERLFDLTDIFERAARESRAVFLYLDAKNCSSCAKYSSFLETNAAELRPIFESLITVDISTRTWGLPIVFMIGDQRYSFDEFKQLVGDQNTFLAFPYFWLIGPNLKLVRQLPIGVFEKATVERHAELLRVP